MDNNRVYELSNHGVTSLEGLYTDFDRWVARYHSCYKRSTYFSKEISTNKAQEESKRNDEEILEKDVFYGDLLLRHQRLPHSSKTTPFYNLKKENDGFVFYDNVFYGLMKKNGDNRIVYQCVRSKL